MERRTKIVCTLGPSTDSYEMVLALVREGMDVARLNFSHGTHKEHQQRIEWVRRASEESGKAVAVLQDLQGPKIRIGEVENDGILIREGKTLELSPNPFGLGNDKCVFVSYPGLLDDVEVGGRILIDDGSLELKVTGKTEFKVITEVAVGGVLRSRKGVNLPNLKSNAPALTSKDLEDLRFGLKMDVDWIALSFVRSGDDVIRLIERIRDSGRNVRVIAKIEKPEAVTDIDYILQEADGIMVARGDLGIEIPMSRVPAVQKVVIQKCMNAGKPVITATQMLESMVENPRPTRAEASDVANAVLDGTDAVMLSGETAAGKYPLETVRAMAEIISEIESSVPQAVRTAKRPPIGPDITAAVSHTACVVSAEVDAKAIACLTHSGNTAVQIARHRPKVPVYAFTANPKVVAQLGVLWGTKAFLVPFQESTDEGIEAVHAVLKREGRVYPGDRVVVTVGMPLPEIGRTNTIHVKFVTDGNPGDVVVK